MKITSIRFLAEYKTQAGTAIVDTVFKLGEGPCGKTVIGLSCDPMEAKDIGFAVCQQHDDGTAKIFTYRWADLRGRMEVDVE